MFWCYGLLNFLLLLGNAFGDVSKSRMRRQDPSAQNGQLIDNIFNIPITAIRQTAAAAQVISPENTQTIDNVFKIPVATLEAVGALVKTTREQRLQNADNIRNARLDRRERVLALKEQKRKRKEEIQNQELLQQATRVVRHYHKDPLGLNAWSNLLVGHHGLLGGHHGGGLGHHLGSGGYRPHRPHRPHSLHGHGNHGGLLGNRPQHTYEVHENVNEDTSFSWHGLTAGLGTFHGARPSNTAVTIQNKVAPKEKRPKVSKYQSDDVNPENKVAKIKNKPEREYDDPPLENKIAPRNGKVTFVQ